MNERSKAYYQKVQRDAANPSASCYISASAGSGKTKIIIDRILNLLLNNIPIESILCITYTNASAQEMATRLEQRLYAWYSDTDEHIRNNLRSLTAQEPNNELVHRARTLYQTFLNKKSELRIQTLHSFCKHLLFTLSTQYNLDDSSIITHSTKNDTLKKAFDSALLYENLSEDSQNFTILEHSINELSQYYDYDSLFTTVSHILEKQASLISSHSTVSDYSTLQGKIYDDMAIPHSYRHHHCDQSDIIADFIRQLPPLDTILNAMQSNQHNDTNILQDWLEQSIQDQIKDFELFNNIFITKTGTARNRPPFDKTNTSAVTLFEEVQVSLIDLAEKINTHHCATLNAALNTFVAHVQHVYLSQKINMNLMEFDDLIILTIRAMQANHGINDFTHYLHNKIHHILIDEAQDLSESQWQIISLLTENFNLDPNSSNYYISTIYGPCPHNTIFIVGDFKQSIYSFQGASPAIFREIASRYKQSMPDNMWKEYDLNICFRFGQNILDFTDKIVKLMKIGNINQKSPEQIAFHSTEDNVTIWEIDYPDHLTQATKAKSTNRIDKLFWYEQLLQNSHDKKHGIITTSNKDQYIAGKIVELIQDLLQKGHKEDEIMVLFRKKCPLQHSLLLSMGKAGINTNNLMSNKPDGLIIFHDMLALGKFCISHHDDMQLAILLKSPIIDISEDELFHVAYQRKSSIWNALNDIVTNSNTHNDSTIVRNLTKYHAILKEYIRIYESCSDAYSFYYQILSSHQHSITTRFDKYHSIKTINNIINTFWCALNKFISVSTIKSLERFVYWSEKNIDELCAQPTDTSGPSHGIRIMTIHRSKGLEANTVILPDILMSERHNKEEVIWHKSMIYAHNSPNCSFINTIRKKHKEELERENIRILYVAATRAKKNLYIVKLKSRIKPILEELV